MYNKNIDKDKVIELFKNYNLYDTIIKYEEYNFIKHDLFEDTGHTLISMLFDINSVKDFNLHDSYFNDEIEDKPENDKIIEKMSQSGYFNAWERSIFYYDEIFNLLIENSILEGTDIVNITRKGINFLNSLIGLFYAEKIILKIIIDKNRGFEFRWHRAYKLIIDYLNYHGYDSFNKIINNIGTID